MVDLVPNRASSSGCELTGSYVPRSSGTLYLAVVYRSEHIKGSPWQVRWCHRNADHACYPEITSPESSFETAQ